MFVARDTRRAKFAKRADAQTADFIWDGGGTNNLWMTAENWEGDGAPVDGTTDGVSRGRLIFSGNSQTISTNNFANDVNFYGVTFTNDNSAGKSAAFALYRTASRKFYLRGHILTAAAVSGVADRLSLSGGVSVAPNVNVVLTSC